MIDQMLMTKKRFSALCTTALVSAFLLPGNVSAQALSDTMRLAVQNHPQVEQVKARLNAADEEESSQFSKYFPELTASTYAGRMYGDNSTSRGLTTTRGAAYSDIWEASLSAKQRIFDGFETSSRVYAAKEQKLSTEMTLDDVREQIALRSSSAHLAVLKARAALTLLEKQNANVADYMQRIKIAVDEGAADEAEYQQARDIRVMLDGYVADYKGELAAATSQYFEVTGEMPPEKMDRPVMNLSEIPDGVDDAIAAAINSHPIIRAAGFVSKSTDYAIDAEEALLYPDLDGELSYLQSDRAEELGGEATDARAIVRMTWKFETGGGQLARIRKKKYEHGEAMAREKDARRQVESRLRLAYAEFSTAKSKLENQKERLELTRKLHETYETQFEGGKVSLLQLMQAENQLMSARLESMMSKYRLMNAGFAILAGMGKLQKSILEQTALMEAPLSPEVKNTDVTKEN